MMNEKIMNDMSKALSDEEVIEVTGGYTSTDHYTHNTLPQPMKCPICGGMIYTATTNTFGPQRVLKAITYHCNGTANHPRHDWTVNY